MRIQIGGLTKQELQQQLRSCQVGMNRYAQILFDDPDFAPAPAPIEVTVVFVSLSDVGLDQGARYDEIVAAASALGLDQCPLEVGPHLRLQYVNQPEGPYLTVASPARSDDPDDPNGFYLRHVDGRLWLRGYEAAASELFEPDFSRFAFIDRPSTSQDLV